MMPRGCDHLWWRHVTWFVTLYKNMLMHDDNDHQYMCNVWRRTVRIKNPTRKSWRVRISVICEEKKKQGNKMLKIDVISLLSQTRNIQTEFYRLYKTTTFWLLWKIHVDYLSHLQLRVGFWRHDVTSQCDRCSTTHWCRFLATHGRLHVD